MYKIIKKFFGNKIAMAFFELIFLVKSILILLINYKKQSISTPTGTILIGLIPTHQNLGDYALYISAKKMIKDFYPNHNILELKISEMPHKLFHYRNLMNKETDLVFLIGGGNMGSRYLTEEFNRQTIFYFFRKYKRIQLPQSASYENSLKGKIIFKISKYIFEKNNQKILLTSRDKKSYEFFKSNFNVNVLLLPDSVLYLKYENKKSRVDKVLFCLRDDKESNFTIDEKQKIKDYLESKFQNLIEFDTINRSENTSNDIAFEQLIDNISTANLIITDRLHGLIFSYITNSNVIALPTCDHKLTNFYTWIKESKKTQLAENLENFYEIVDKENFDHEESNQSFEKQFLILKNEIEKL